MNYNRESLIEKQDILAQRIRCMKNRYNHAVRVKSSVDANQALTAIAKLTRSYETVRDALYGPNRV